MIRMIAGIVAGLIAWISVATIGNLMFRVAWPGYAEAEISMMFTLAMMVARLSLGALSSLCAGFVTAYCGEMLMMPGLPSHPSGELVDINEAGETVGLF